MSTDNCSVCDSNGHPSWAHPVQCKECKMIGGHHITCSQHPEDSSGHGDDNYTGAEIQVPGYQLVAVERDDHGTTWLYMGSNFVAFTPTEWARFEKIVTGVTAKQAGGVFRPGRGS